MVDIRPHRRLAVPFEAPYFADLVEISDFLSYMYEHVGVARFNSTMFSFTSTAIMHRMCKSIGLKLLVDCRTGDEAVQAASEGADFVTIPSDSVHSVVASVAGSRKVLVRVSDGFDLEIASSSSADGVFCDSSMVARCEAFLPAGRVIFASGGDVVSAVKDGADFATIGDSVIRAEKPDEAARQLAEDFREFT